MASIYSGSLAALGNVLGNAPTVGSVLFVGAAGILQQDNASLFWDDTADHLGIGTSTPATFRLEVAGDIGPDADNTWSIGSTGRRYAAVHVGPGSLQIHNDATDTDKLTIGYSGTEATLLGTQNARFDTTTALRLGTTSATSVSISRTGQTSTVNGALTVTQNTTFSAMTVGSILFAGAAGLLSQDNASLFWDDTNNRLGLGTTTPARALDLLGTVDNGSSGTIRGSRTLSATTLSFASVVSRAISTGDMADDFGAGFAVDIRDTAGVDNFAKILSGFRNGADNSIGVALYTLIAGVEAERLRITATGLSGFGTTTPQNRLDVSGAMALGTYAGVNTAPTDGAIISGNVGIGTTTPLSVLHLSGTPLLFSDYFSADTASTAFLGRKARGSAGSPTQALANDNLAQIIGRGYQSGGAFATANNAKIGIFAAENFTATAQGTYITCETTPTGSTTRVERVRVDPSGGVGVGTLATNNAAALLQVDSTTKGFLPPRMTTAQRDAISTPPSGLMIYNTTTNKLNFRAAAAWEAVTSA